MRLNGITRKFCQEERNSDAERRKVCGALLLDCEHEDYEHELGCQEYLNEQALSDGCAAAEHGVDSHGAWVHRRHEAGGCDSSNELSGDNEETANCGHSTAKPECKCDLRQFRTR
jgi:hypothetical protein